MFPSSNDNGRNGDQIEIGRAFVKRSTVVVVRIRGRSDSDFFWQDSGWVTSSQLVHAHNWFMSRTEPLVTRRITVPRPSIELHKHTSSLDPG
jgi:hypothetical protein